MSEAAQDAPSEPEIRALLRDYANALDRGEFGRWPEFFAAQCRYRITTRDNVERGYPLSIMLCSNRAMLFDRIEATEKANVYEPHRYRHVLSESEIARRLDGSAEVRTSFLCVRIMLTGEMTLFACGEYVDEIVREEGRCRFRARAVILDGSKIDSLIAIPL
ncbi:MAG TPA: aromatic-ring-hydroxylating dioxygenase subunit beta [Alphaproteobacteria bacterium]|nr:aromatic-ring-hydroxylating dioxygenase subunit beta [Alphaproteobacteria bacterium]